MWRALAVAFAMIAASVAALAEIGPLKYQCDDGTIAIVTFIKRPAVAVLDIGGKSIRLPQARSGSGARYMRGKTSFWIKGNDAMFDRDGASTNCHTG